MEYPHTFFQYLLSVVQTAKLPSDNISVLNVEVGALKLTLHFVGQTVAQKFSPAFQHCVSAKNNTSPLNIFVVDGKVLKMPQMRPPWQSDQLVNGDLWVSDSAEMKIMHQPDKKVLMMLEIPSRTAIYWVDDASELPNYEGSAPLRQLLHWYASINGEQLLHAAAVGNSNGGILFVGKSGSGKSNTAVSALDSDLYYLADDYCLVSFNEVPMIHCLYSTAKLSYDDIERHPILKQVPFVGSAEQTIDEKALFLLNDLFSDRILAKAPIKAVVVPKVTHGAEATIQPISPSAAYLALAPSTIFQMHGERKTTHDNISKLVRAVPCFGLDLSTDPFKNNKAIMNLLKDL